MANNPRDKFLELYEKEANSIFRFCLVRTSDRETAKDLSQEAFLKFWKAYQNGGIKNERTFLWSITRHLIIDWYRKKKSLSLDAITLESEESFDIPDGLWPSEGARIEGRFALSKIKELTGPYREVIYLRFVESLKPAEIAEVLGESVNSVSVRLTRALESLRKLLKIEEGDKYYE